MALGSALEHVDRRRIRELMALLDLEVDRDALVEVVEALHLAEAPRLAQDKRALLETDELLKGDHRLVERLLAEAGAVQKRKKKAIFRRLLQGVTDANGGQALGELHLMLADELEGSFEILLFRALNQLIRQRFRNGHFRLL